MMTSTVSSPEDSIASSELEHRVRLILMLGTLVTLLLIPLKVISLGYMPKDDALRHSARVIADKPWDQILVTDGKFPMELSFGWDLYLQGWHSLLGLGADGLVVVSILTCWLVFLFLPLRWVRHPIVWLAVLVLLSLVGFERWSLGRPLILAQAFLMVCMFILCRRGNEDLTRRDLIAMGVAIGLSSFIHGSWYLWAMLPMALVLDARWREAIRLGMVWLIAVVASALLTLQPVTFLVAHAKLPLNALGGFQISRTMVTEFFPSNGTLAWLGVLAIVWILSSPTEKKLTRGEKTLWVFVCLTWLLGIKVGRFWYDWGIPASLVWLVLRLEGMWDRLEAQPAWVKLRSGGGILLAAFLVLTANYNDRWTRILSVEFLEASNPEHQEWLPEPGGILYSSEMGHFFLTIYKNPKADWKYILGPEAGLMTDEDYKIWWNIRWNFGAGKAYLPWVEKMTPKDRLIKSAGSGQQPDIPGLEWHFVATDTWSGRLPREGDASNKETQTPVDDPEKQDDKPDSGTPTIPATPATPPAPAAQ